jgi:hypothetical protein
MELNRGRLNWGTFFIILGAVPLAYHENVVSASTLGDVWRLWPLILVGIGLGLILRRTPAYFVGGLVVAACMGLVFGSVLAVGPNIGCGNNGSGQASVVRDGSFDGTAQVSLQLQCGSANLTTSSDNQWHVRASSSSYNTPTVSASADSLTVSSGSRDHWWLNRGEDSWDVALPPSASIGLSVSIDAGDAHLNLNGATLTSASFSLNAGSLHVDLTNARLNDLSMSTNAGAASLILSGNSSVSGSISTNVGSLDLCAPAGLGLQFRSSESLASTNFSRAGLVRVGDAWQTQGYDTAAFKADFSVSTSVGSLTLNPAGGCK